LVSGIRPHRETGPYKRDASKRLSFPPKAARAELDWERRKPCIPDSDNDASRSAQELYEVEGAQSGVRHATIDGTADGEETELARKLREDGVVDLRNTVDTDGDITWAPGKSLHSSPSNYFP
jgi:hypothetical protein